MAVEILNRTKSRINQKLIRLSVEAVLNFKKFRGDISVVIVSDQMMKKLNKEFRGYDKPTDILSFAEKDSLSLGDGFIGELFIDINQIKRQTKEFKTSFSWELSFIVIHGTLHLLGYEDETEKGRLEMEKLGYKIIKKIL